MEALRRPSTMAGCMTYEDDAEEHELLVRQLFALQRRYAALPEAREPERALLREMLAELTAQIERLRRAQRPRR